MSVEDRAIQTLRAIQIGVSEDERREMFHKLPKAGKYILWDNSRVFHWAASYRSPLSVAGDEYKDLKRIGMSVARSHWFLLSNLYVVNDMIGIEVNTETAKGFMVPLGSAASSIKFSAALEMGLVSQEKDKNTRFVSLTSKGRKLVTEHTKELLIHVDEIAAYRDF